jgi:hypothetical protein
MPDLKSRIHWPVLLIAALMALLTILAFFPGRFSPDSTNYLGQALTGQYNDLHPVIMAAVWRFLLLWVWDNPGVLLVVHALLYWLIWAFLATTVSQKPYQQILILAVATLPPLWSQIIVIWTDPELSLSLLGCYLFGLWAFFSRPKKPGPKSTQELWFLGLALLCFIYSATVRKNSLPALIPLAFFLSQAVFRNISRAKAIFLAGCLCVFSLLAADVINHGYLKASKTYVFQLVQTFDVVGVYSQTRRADLIPKYWMETNKKLTPEMLLNAYSPYTEVPLTFWGDPVVPMTLDPGQLRELTQKWLWAMKTFPIEFLRHRWDAYKRLLAIGEPKVFFPLCFEVAENNWGVRDQGDPGLQKALKSYFNFFRNSFFFRGWAYLSLLLVLMGYQWFRLSDTSPLKLAALCSALSAFLFGATYFAYVPAAEFRFLYPVVTLFFLSLILTLFAPQASVPRPKRRKNHLPKRAR